MSSSPPNHRRNPLGRTLRLLTWMADRGAADYGVRELAGAVHMAPSTVHRSLGALQDEGLVESDGASGRYRLSLGFYRLALRGASQVPLLDLALPQLREAAKTGGETALLALYDPLQLAAMFVAQVPSRHTVQVRTDLYEWFPLPASAAGQAILAWLEPEVLVSVVAASRPKPDASRLAETLAAVRGRGFASVPGRPGTGAVALAAPFWGPGTAPLGALLFAIPESRMNPVLEASLGQLLVERGAALTASLGGSAA
ncbi:MAG: IclR family transcriptional regulator [Candidatus Dormibacteria bacterium]